MSIKVNFLTAILFFLIPFYGYGQNLTSKTKNDTIFIYETVTVYDTVFIYDTVRVSKETKLDFIQSKGINMSILQLDTINKSACLLFISNNQSATIPINSIILNENNKKLRSMKKISFFGVVLFAFQSMIIGQIDYGVSAGAGTWWANCNQSVVKTGYSPMLNAGLWVSRKSKAFDLITELGINFQYLRHNSNYQLTNYGIITQFNWQPPMANDNLNQLSLPLCFIWDAYILKPYFGIENSLLSTISGLPKINSDPFRYYMYNLSLSFGLRYQFSDRISLGIGYNKGLSHVFNLNNTSKLVNGVTEIQNISYYWKTNQLNFSLFYNLKRNKTVK